jgi:hypothetical protein
MPDPNFTPDTPRTEYIPGTSYRDYNEVYIPGPSLLTRAVGIMVGVFSKIIQFIWEYIWAISVFCAALIIVGFVTLMVSLDNKREALAINDAKDWLTKHNYSQIATAYVWFPTNGFTTGTGCLGKKFEVNFSALTKEDKYIEAAVCCSNNSDCRFNKYTTYDK